VKSRDLGKTWTRVNVGTAAEGAVGNSDVGLAVAPDGTLYFATMGPDLWQPDASKKQNTIAVGATKDAGATWHWTVLSKLQSIFGDRPWVAVTTDGAAHVIWNDGSGVEHRVTKAAPGRSDPEFMDRAGQAISRPARWGNSLCA
jgi:hypothetical protein